MSLKITGVLVLPTCTCPMMIVPVEKPQMKSRQPLNRQLLWLFYQQIVYGLNGAIGHPVQVLVDQLADFEIERLSSPLAMEVNAMAKNLNYMIAQLKLVKM